MDSYFRENDRTLDFVAVPDRFRNGYNIVPRDGAQAIHPRLFAGVFVIGTGRCACIPCRNLREEGGRVYDFS
ncbi:MAG: hypothetical protein ACP5M0_07310 [Desulfomonilaceae bacterium]